MSRRLRIAVSVFFALVALALSVLWLQTQARQVSLLFKLIGPTAYQLNAAKGRLLFGWLVDSDNSFPQFAIVTTAMDPGWEFGGFEFAFRRTAPFTALTMPLWPLIGASVVLAIAPLFAGRYRFSLRTMLIATTLIAVLLGLGVWLAR